MSRTKGLNDAQRSERDLYATPQWCVDIIAKRICKTVVLPDPFSVVDLGAGDGRIGSTVYDSMSDGRFIEPDLVMVDIQRPTLMVMAMNPARARWIVDDYRQMALADVMSFSCPVLAVSNPPFSIVDEFVMRTVDTMKIFPSIPHVAIFLLRINWLGSERRAAWIDANPPSRMTILAPRPSFCTRETIMEDGTVKKSSNDACEYAWVWWENLRFPGPFVNVDVWPLTRSERRVWRAEQRKSQGGPGESCNHKNQKRENEADSAGECD